MQELIKEKMDKYLSEPLIAQLAKDFNLEERIVKTVIRVESAGSGFDKNTQKIKIQFEPHIFKRETGIVIENGVDVQTQEWIAFNAAYRINPEAAMHATSWGCMQVMGFNHDSAGYHTVGEMVTMFKESEYYQVAGGLYFIKSYPNMYRALKEMDWATFARYYNGKNYHQFSYDIKLNAAYKALG